MLHALRILTAALFVYAYYDYGKRALFTICKRLAARLPLAKKHPLHHIDNAVELLAVGVSHIALCALLTVVLGLDARALGFTATPALALLILLGVPLGIGEMVLSALLCRAILQTLLVVAPANAPSDLQGWLTVSRGGWMRHYVRTVEILPMFVTLPLTCLNVGAEEFVFRGLMLNYFSALGPVIAIVLATAFFALMQTFLMPSWTNALFPVVGALVMGVTHGVLFTLVPCLPPLIVAHLVFFAFAMV
jgi:membrane protease YdiL (CAAX protease family)